MQSWAWLCEISANLIELKGSTYSKIISTSSRRHIAETTPLIDSRGDRHRLHLLGHWRSWRKSTNRLSTDCKRYLQSFRLAKERFLEYLKFVQPMVWPNETSGLCYRPIQCEGVLVLQCVLHWLFPNLLGSLTESLSLLDSITLRHFIPLTGTFICWFLKDRVCKWLRSRLWLDVTLLSQSIIQAKALETAFNRLDKKEELGNGGFLSDFNKGGSIIDCLEVVLFTWIPTFFYLLTTIVDLWCRLGITYGLIVTIIGLLYICLIVCNALRFVPYRRREVEKKRDRATITTQMLKSVVDIGLQGGSKVELAKFEQVQSEYQDRVRESSIVLISQDFFPNMILLVGFYIMAICIMQHPQNRVRSFTIIITYMVELQRLLQSVADSTEKFSNGVVNSERIISVLKYQISFESIPLAASLEPLTFLCKANTTTIHHGISRNGRQQLMMILARFEEPQLGTIRINALDIQVYSIESVRDSFCFISHEHKLLGPTVLQCLTYGLENLGRIDRGSVVDACKVMNIHDLIMDNAGGYDAPVIQGSCIFKREERRRFALVRAIVGKSWVLVLEGQITALESETVQKLQEVINAATEGRTVIILE